MRFLLASALTLAFAGAAVAQDTRMLTRAQCEAAGGVAASSITSRTDPDPVRPCHFYSAQAMQQMREAAEKARSRTPPAPTCASCVKGAQ